MRATDDEAALARQLRERVTAALASGDAIPALWLAVLALLPAAAFAARRRRASGQDLARGALPACSTQQVREPAEEADAARHDPGADADRGRRLAAVRQQYEENPYPRWVEDRSAEDSRCGSISTCAARFPAAPFRSSARPSSTC